VSEPWFDPNRYAWVFGTALGIGGGMLGSLAGTLATRGKAKPLVMGLFVTALLACAAMLVAGVVALVQQQPYGVWYGLGLPGLLGLVVLGGLLPVVQTRYREAEQRRLSARDLG
jgi:peptidoglycan/LPS O-acetylase OafA/YrhL